MPEAPVFTPLEVWDRGQVVDALISRRVALGWRGEDLDHRAGWADRLGAKLEKPATPSGRAGFHFEWPTELLPGGSMRATGMGSVWLQALGLRLVLVDDDTARAIGAQPAPTGPPAALPRRTGGDNAAFHATKRRERRIDRPMAAPQYETADRTLVAQASFRIAVTDHPWISERPALRAAAEEIETKILELYESIRASA